MQVPFWTEERLAEIKRRHADGETCGEIAYAMHTTRNAVIGKLGRLKLRVNRPQPQVPHKRKRRRKSPTPIAAPRIPLLPANFATDLPLDEFANPKSLIELAANECHWPGRGSPATEFCAEPVHPGRPYCARHTAAAYHRLPGKVRL